MADGSTDALPVWMAGLAGRAGTSPSSLLRILLGSELLLAGLMFLIGRWARALAIVTMIATCFSAIASISAAPEQRSVVGFNVLVLVVSAVLLWSVLRGRTAGGGTLSLQWQLIGALAVGVVAATMASQIPIRVVDPSGPELRVKRPPQAIELDFARFINQPLTASGIGKHLPQLTAKALDGRHIIVFYNTSCGICHELFREHFSGHLSTPVIAVRVPPGVNDRVLESDQPGDIDCPECERLSLREGPTWLVTPPTLVVVENGIIKCVAIRSTGDCLEVDTGTAGPG
jgi:uncharacterized membrane protein YphA (DoxX/SURF4 family)